jgi:hypothetical protein
MTINIKITIINKNIIKIINMEIDSEERCFLENVSWMTEDDKIMML